MRSASLPNISSNATCTVALITLVLAFGLTTANHASAHDVPLRCGDRPEAGAGWFDLHAHRAAGCKTARILAEKFHDRAINGGGFPRRLNANGHSWRCRTRQEHPEVWRVRCTAPNRVVHFRWGF